MQTSQVHEISHPLILHKLSIMRRKETSVAKFRRLLEEISMLLCYEVTRDLPLSLENIETPVATMNAPFLKGKKLVFVSILRAGNGILNGMLELIPSARVGHIGLFRDPATLECREYFFRLPEHMEDRDVIIVDPMLATGHSAVAAVERVKASYPKSIKFLCLVAAPEGLKVFHTSHPEIPVFTASVDQRLNEHGYIVPGLGDAGDRIFGTKLDC